MNTFSVPKIEKSCPANWDDMKGDEKRRFCEHCQLHVHNLSAMTLEEQRTVLDVKGRPGCISYVAQPDAVAVAPDRWLRQNTGSSSSWQRIAALFVALMSLIGVGCQNSAMPKQDCSASTQASIPTVSAVADGKRTMGVPMMPERPFWKRLLGIH